MLNTVALHITPEPGLMNKQTIRICILGGGFGGLYTALRLTQFPWDNSYQPEITLIDKSDRFLFSPLLYELMTGEMQSWEIAPPFEELLSGTDILFKQACVTGIDIEAREIQLDNETSISYDKLVVAIGGKTPLDIIPGAKDHAIPFRTLNDAYRLGERLRILEQSDADKIRVAIVGGGYSGVELACKLADRLGERGRLRLIEKQATILATSPQFNREAAKKALEKRLVWLDLDTEVQSITSDTISLLYKGQIDTIPVDIVLWTVGTQVSESIQKLPLKHDQRGLLTTNAFLQASDRPEIYALGDVANCQDITGQQVPATAQSALQQSDFCAWNIWASITRRPLLPFRYFSMGEMMTLGIDNATISGLGVKLEGIPAYILRRLIYLYRLPTLKHQLNVGLNWITQPVIELLAR
ncbi:NADH dehydrogenase, FAD-containing subunit [Pleurocapsa sp. PCC 7327]|nr:NADH dehydrogenase, FAD-containing subunit [Pleurocapsa sp. PCC 7327]